MFDDRVFSYQEAWEHLRALKNITLRDLPNMAIGQFRSREVRLPLSSVASFVSDYRDEVFPDEENHCHKGVKFDAV